MFICLLTFHCAFLGNSFALFSAITDNSQNRTRHQVDPYSIFAVKSNDQKTILLKTLKRALLPLGGHQLIIANVTADIPHVSSVVLFFIYCFT